MIDKASNASKDGGLVQHGAFGVDGGGNATYFCHLEKFSCLWVMPLCTSLVGMIFGYHICLDV